jgi:hypothetical protein
MEDYDHRAKMICDAIAVCDKNKDSPTTPLSPEGILQEILDMTERRKWSLYEVMQGEKNTE